MTPIATVRAALAALAEAPAAERRDRLCELKDAKKGLEELVGRYEAWLNTEHIALTEIEADGLAIADSAFEERRERWIGRVKVYERSRDVLGEALAMMGEAG